MIDLALSQPVCGVTPMFVLRGGSWNNNPENARCANRNNNNPNNVNNNVGVRVVVAGDDSSSAGQQTCTCR